MVVVGSIACALVGVLGLLVVFTGFIFLLFWISKCVIRRRIAALSSRVSACALTDWQLNARVLTTSTKPIQVAWNSTAMLMEYTVVDNNDESTTVHVKLFVKHTPVDLTMKTWLSHVWRGVTGEMTAHLLFSPPLATKSYLDECIPWCGWFLSVAEFMPSKYRVSIQTLEMTTIVADGSVPPPPPPPALSRVPLMLESLANVHSEYLVHTKDLRAATRMLQRRATSIGGSLQGDWTKPRAAFVEFATWVYVIHHANHRQRGLAKRSCYHATRQVLQETLFPVSHDLLCVIHGDAHPDNFRHTEHMGSIPIDWAACRIDSPFFDMTYCLLTSTPADVRSVRKDEWIRHYAAALQRSMSARGSRSHESLKSFDWYHEKAKEGYYSELARIIVFHVLPFCYAEGAALPQNLMTVLKQAERIRQEVVVAGCQELTRAGKHGHVVKWVQEYAVAYHLDNDEHPAVKRMQANLAVWQTSADFPFAPLSSAFG